MCGSGPGHHDKIIETGDPESSLAEWMGPLSLGKGTIFMSYWYAALYVVVEGWGDLGLTDPAIDALLAADYKAKLRRHRNETCHYREGFFVDKWNEFENTPVPRSGSGNSIGNSDVTLSNAPRHTRSSFDLETRLRIEASLRSNNALIRSRRAASNAAIRSRVPGVFASQPAHERDTPSCRAMVAILMPGEHSNATMLYRFAIRFGVVGFPALYNSAA